MDSLIFKFWVLTVLRLRIGSIAVLYRAFSIAGLIQSGTKKDPRGWVPWGLLVEKGRRLTRPLRTDACPPHPHALALSIPCIVSQLTKALNQPVLVVSLGYMPKP